MTLIVPPATLALELTEGSIRGAARNAETTRKDVLLVAPSDIHVLENFNIRVKGTKAYLAEVEKWASSIEAEGWHSFEPATCYVGKNEKGVDVYYLIDGHTRMDALALIKSRGGVVPDKIPLILTPPGTSMEDLTIQLLRGGRTKTPFELATGIKRLQGMGVEDKVIASRLSMTKRYLDELVGLLAAPAKIRNLLAQDAISATEVMRQIREKGAAAALEDIAAAAEEKAQAAVAPSESTSTGKKAAAAKKASSTRITRQDIERTANRKQATRSAPRKAQRGGVLEEAFSARPGEIVKLDAIRPFLHLFNADWFSTGDTSAGKVTITRRVRFKLSAYRKPAGNDDVDTGGL